MVLPDGHPSPAVLAHAYYRLLQHHLMHSLGGEYLSAPGWLIEGTAAYGETLYSLQGGTGQADFVNRWEALVVGDTSITDVIGDDAANRERTVLGHPDGAALDASHHQLVASGIAWLVERAGNDDAHLEYWRLLAAAGDSNRAFASAFGMTVDTFLEAFEAYRADATGTLPLVQGVLTDLAGEPLPGTRVEVIPIDTAERTTGTYSALATFRARGVGASAATTAHDGSFAIPVLPDWRYLVYLPRLFPSASDAPAGGAFPGLPVDAETGAVNRCGPLSFLVVGSDDVSNLEINVLFQLLTMQERPVCGRAPTIVQLAGIVRAPDAGPAARVRVCAYQYSSASEDCASSGEDGTFALRVPPGEIWLRLHSTRGVSGWYGDGTWVRHRSQRTPIPVGGSGIRGLEVRMRAFLFGRVVGPDSGLLIARYLIVCTEHASPAARNDCTGIEDDGSFFVAVAPGAVSLQVLTTAGELGWYGEDGGLTSEEERAVIQVAGSDVSDIEIHLHEGLLTPATPGFPSRPVVTGGSEAFQYYRFDDPSARSG